MAVAAKSDVEWVPMGSIVVDGRVLPRIRADVDHVNAIVADLVNGAVKPEDLPPILVDRGTRKLIDGLHRYTALRHYYGDNWEKKEVKVEYIDLPPFEEDPLAWWKVSLERNAWKVLRLSSRDRMRVAREVLRNIPDVDDPRLEEIRLKLSLTKEALLAILQEMKPKPRPKAKARPKAKKTEKPLPVPEERTILDPVGPTDIGLVRSRSPDVKLMAQASRARTEVEKVSELMEVWRGPIPEQLEEKLLGLRRAIIRCIKALDDLGIVSS